MACWDLVSRSCVHVKTKSNDALVETTGRDISLMTTRVVCLHATHAGLPI